MISSRICGPDDQLAVRRFVCCGAGAPEYAMDVQRYIRGLDLKENADDVLRMALYSEGDSDVLAFCEFGWIGSSDAYAISVHHDPDKSGQPREHAPVQGVWVLRRGRR